MKHYYFSVLFLIISFAAYAQDEVIKLDNYSASNGITYSVRDRFILGEGSAANGEFRYVSFLGWDDVLFPQGEITEFNLEASSAGAEVKLKKIKKFYSSGSTEVIFKIGIGSLVNYFINIEKAIASCEIEKCKSLDERVGVAFEEPVSENEDHKDLEIIHAEIVDEEPPKEVTLDDLDEAFLDEMPEKVEQLEATRAENRTRVAGAVGKKSLNQDTNANNNKSEKYEKVPLYAFFISIGIITYLYYRKYRIQDRRFKTGYRMPDLGIRKMVARTFYIFVLTLILMPLGYLLVYLGIF